MKIIIVYRSASDHGQAVEEFVREFTYRKPDLPITLQSIDDRDGADTAELYGVMVYPAILVIGSDGQLMKDWQGTPLPLMDELAYYATS